MSESLNTLLLTLSHADDGLVELSNGELKELVGEIGGKVDQIKDVLSRMDSEALRMKSIIDDFTTRKRTLENGSKRLKEYVTFSMSQSGTTKLTGDWYSVQMQSKTSYKPQIAEPDSDDYISYNTINNRLVKNVYKWDLNEFTRLAKSDPIFCQDHATVSKKEHTVFRAINKFK